MGNSGKAWLTTTLGYTKSGLFREGFDASAADLAPALHTRFLLDISPLPLDNNMQKEGTDLRILNYRFTQNNRQVVLGTSRGFRIIICSQGR